MFDILSWKKNQTIFIEVYGHFRENITVKILLRDSLLNRLTDWFQLNN